MPSASPDPAADRCPAALSDADHAASDVLAAAARLSRLPERLDPTTKRIIGNAGAQAGGAEHLSVEHLFRALMAVDCGFVFRKLRSIRLPVQAAIRQANAAGADRRPPNPSAVITVLQLADGLAPRGVAINTQHLLVAILLEGTNGVAQQVLASGIDLGRLLIRQFTCLPQLRDVVSVVVGGQRGEDCCAPHPVLGAALSRALSALAPAVRTPPAPWPQVDWPPVKVSAPPPSAVEAKARRWLEKLLPNEAERYSRLGFVEISSGLFPQRSYRIYRSGRISDVFERGKLVARRCLKLGVFGLPPTDRVIAEYFLIRGDERTYLKTAIRSRC